MEYIVMQRRSGQDEFPCVACGGEISTHDPRIVPEKGAAYKRPPPVKQRERPGSDWALRLTDEGPKLYWVCLIYLLIMIVGEDYFVITSLPVARFPYHLIA